MERRSRSQKKAQVGAVPNPREQTPPKPVPSSPTSASASSSSPSAAAAPPRKVPSLTEFYLVAYNTISAFFWAAVLLRVVLILPLLGPENVAGGTADFARWVQTGALLEIVHSLVGIVKSPVVTTVIQVSSRILLTWGVTYLFPKSGARHLAYSTMLISWSVTEIIRYSFYASNLKGSVPKWLTWLRYNTFFVLYPSGVTSELLVVYASLDDAKQFSVLYYYLLIAIMISYIPGFYTMFTHVLKQRRRAMRQLK
ncbi:tyrosine phosphatase-like protein [Myxozyma melibiosi]|uniref:Very-long-chain (3R)-3-hydroxyacyl-CoA dehydratase n=1 Tax=Myxozyma melibiosi TaxID=54550 RepID=A0ABR1F6F4_9ASCO